MSSREIAAGAAGSIIRSSASASGDREHSASSLSISMSFFRNPSLSRYWARSVPIICSTSSEENIIFIVVEEQPNRLIRVSMAAFAVVVFPHTLTFVLSYRNCRSSVPSPSISTSTDPSQDATLIMSSVPLPVMP